jgi:putative ABC transport system permease protein
MTLTRFVTKNAFRNKRRSILTVLSIAFSLLLLTLMMTLWRGFYLDQGSAESAERLVVRHRVSLTFFLPSFYREKIRAIPGVVAVVPLTWFQGVYKDQKPENFFARFATDPDEFFKVYRDVEMPEDQIKAWQRDRQGVIVDETLAKKYGWKLGDRIFVQGDIFPVNLDLIVRGIFHSTPDNRSVYFNAKYVEEAVSWFKGQAGTFGILVDSPADVSKVAAAVDDMFHNSPQPTKTESAKAFGLEFVAMLGNVKAFILGICSAVLFATLLVSANTMAMSIRERTREVAVLRTLGFPRGTILSVLVGEAVTLALIAGILGSFWAFFPLCLIGAMASSLLVFLLAVSVRLITWKWRRSFRIPFAVSVLVGAILGTLLGLVAGGRLPVSSAGYFADALTVHPTTVPVAWGVAALVGFMSAVIPSYHASQVNIVDGLRHIG